MVKWKNKEIAGTNKDGTLDIMYKHNVGTESDPVYDNRWVYGKRHVDISVSRDRYNWNSAGYYGSSINSSYRFQKWTINITMDKRLPPTYGNEKHEYWWSFPLFFRVVKYNDRYEDSRKFLVSDNYILLFISSYGPRIIHLDNTFDKIKGESTSDNSYGYRVSKSESDGKLKIKIEIIIYFGTDTYSTFCQVCVDSDAIQNAYYKYYELNDKLFTPLEFFPQNYLTSSLNWRGDYYKKWYLNEDDGHSKVENYVHNVGYGLNIYPSLNDYFAGNYRTYSGIDSISFDIIRT